MKGLCALSVTSLAAVLPLPAQTPRELTVDWIMRGPELVGREPSEVRWSPDSRWIYFRWLLPGSAWRETLKPYRVRAEAGAAPEALTPAQADSAAPFIADGPWSLDRRRRSVGVRGDLWLLELPAGTARRLTETPATETPLGFDTSGRTLFFRRDDNVFGADLETGLIRQVTDLRPGPAPDTAARTTPQRTFLEREQESLIGAVRDRRWRDSVDKAERERVEAQRPKPTYLQKDERVVQLQPSPNGTHVLVVLSTREEDRTTRVPAYVTLTGYTEDLTARTKVGDVQPRRRVGVLEVASGAVTWLRPDPADTSAATFGELNALGWNDAGTAALLWVVSRDWTTRSIDRVTLGSARVTSLEVLRDTAWVGGPCFGCAGWLPGDQGVWFVSEADGWSHLYTVAATGGPSRQLTRGQWEVLDVTLSPDRSTFRLHTSEPSVFERHYYEMPVRGGGPGLRTRLTGPTGGHTVTPSPDGRQLAIVHSQANRPPELFLQPARPQAGMTKLTSSPTEAWLGFGWLSPEIVSIPASDGVQVPARIYRPADLGARPNGAAVIFVHGAGYLHNVHRFWSSYYREYMFHHLLAQRGYVVLDLDYRGSAGYGRDWRTAIYRHMGGKDLQDQVDASRWLERELSIPPERVGIYGGSYGGFITLMALFTEGSRFGAGAALRSVTDWAHYNHGYTSRILNEPQGDSVSYRRSSPIYFAEGLDDPLLIAHGMVDVNVHFQDVVRLSQRLIELQKTGWEMAIYPVEDHGFVRPDSWTDEYRRILELFDRHLLASGHVGR